MRSIDDAIEWIYGLHVGVTGTGTARHEKPHKPVLLLAVLAPPLWEVGILIWIQGK